MTIQLLASQIPVFWNHIRYAVLTANKIKDEQAYCRNLLINLLSGKTQAWVVVEEDEIRAILITRIIGDIGEMSHLLIDVAYGFKPISDKDELMEKMVEFGKNIGAATVTTFTSNQMASNAAMRAGMKKSADMFTVEIGG